VRRVALVIGELRPGGAERVVVHLGTALRERGVDPRVITLGPRGPLADDLEKAGVSVACLGSTRGYDVGCLWRLRGILRRFRPDVVHVHDRASLPYVTAAARLGGSPPVVYTGHGLILGEPERARLRYRLAARRIAAMTAVSEEVAARHARYLGWRGVVDVVPNGVPDPGHDPARRDQVRGELGIAPGTFVFLSVGNARPEKGFEDLLRAAVLLRDGQAARPWVAVVAGTVADTPYCRDLRAQQEALRLQEAVRFLGFRQDVGSLYAAADAFVLSSRSEGLPMAVLEAMMSGLPVIATRVGGVPSAVADAGRLVEARAPGDLAAAMATLLEDPALCEALGRRGRERAIEAFGVDRMAARYLEVFERVASSGRLTAER
jgi:glycosyltransferase involved in cell wall biosynthesis